MVKTNDSASGLWPRVHRDRSDRRSIQSDSSDSEEEGNAFRRLGDESIPGDGLSRGVPDLSNPIDEECAQSNHPLEMECPEKTASFFSRLTFSWFSDMIRLGYRRTLQDSDLWEVQERECASNCSKKFSEEWNRLSLQVELDNREIRASREHRLRNLRSDENPEQIENQFKEKTPSVVYALHRAFGRRFYLAGIIKFVYDICNLSSPLFLNWIVSYLEDSSAPFSQGLFIVGALLGVQLLGLLLIHTYFHIVMTTGMHVRAGLVTAVYRKSLKLSPQAQQQFSTGKVVTLMSVDTQKMLDLMTYLHVSWSGVLQISVTVGMLFYFLGWVTVAGVLLLVLLVPLQSKLAHIQGGYRKQCLEKTDDRVKFLSEILSGIRVLKFYAWENSFFKRISDVREAELNRIRAASYVQAVVSSLMGMAPVLVSVVTLMLYALVGNEVKASTIFTALALLNILRFPLAVFPMVISSIIQAKVSLGRINSFLSAPELPGFPMLQDRNFPIKVENGEFEWPEPSPKESQDKTVSNTKPSLLARVFCCRKDKGSISSSTGAASSNSLSQAQSMSSLSSESDAFRRLADINFRAPRGSLTIVVGPVGCGKSSLISAILGEMPRVSGSVGIEGSVSYVPQQAWIQNATVQENILFGRPMNRERYDTVIHCCALERDLEILLAGDQTEIGEKGINLSGGQKQRINLARAVYSDSDVIILDDPLSAVDAHVGRFLFEECINGLLRGKTRFLVTHQLQFVPFADQVVIMKEGRIAEIGSYADLMSSPTSALRETMSHVGLGHEESSSSQSSDQIEELNQSARDDDVVTAQDPNQTESTRGPNPPSTKKQEKTLSKSQGSNASDKVSNAGKLVEAESRSEGSVESWVYLRYVRALGGLCIAIFIVALFVSSQVANLSSNFWLAIWSNSAAAGYPSDSPNFYVLIYAMIAVSMVLIRLIQDFTAATSGIRAARNLHFDALKRVLRAPMRFFDTTPTGRIVNRFSKDQETIDLNITDTIKTFLFCVFTVLVTLLLIGIALPWFLVFVSPVMYMYFRYQQFYRRTSREIKRLDSISRSPIFSHFSETLAGLSTIRAYREEDRFILDNEKRLNCNNRAYFCQIVSQRWLGIRLEFIGAAIVFFSALFGVFSHGQISPGIVALCLSYSMSVTGILNWAVRQATEVEIQMNAVERVSEYCDQLEMEAELENENDRKLDRRSWPSAGAISFRNVVMHYKKDDPPVLRGITLDIPGGSKVGIIGRTGSGKSTLACAALFRLVELSEGSIVIDGVDVASLGLHRLRSAIAIIPQDPVLFSGSMRFNIDPFSEFSDDSLEEALRRVGLWNKFSSGSMGRDSSEPASLSLSSLPSVTNESSIILSSALDFVVSENGSNLSVGERQLVCLARAMLKDVRILVLDEATASVDSKTDMLIQRTVRDVFDGCTILTIAHRLNTIVDSDFVLVLDHGEVKEFDSPARLLERSESEFSSMIDELGPSVSNRLRAVARGEILPEFRAASSQN